MSEQNSLIGQVISGCEILEKTAEGGMGAVYRARHRALNRIVCVKILSPGLSKDKKAVELFLTEARAIAELDHPNIVNVYNVGKEGGYYFIVMSFIEGQTLSAMLKKEKVLPIKRVLDLFDGVLQGLHAAHEKGIIHRDIKPSNILITPQGQAKLVDFGIAKKVDKTGSTKTTELAGTAYFIAPEQALGKNLDTRADLYSIGASLYYVLTGRFPYNGKNTIEIIQKHISDPVPDPIALRKDLPAWLGPAVQKLMSKNPDDRFQTAKETCEYFRKMRAEDQLTLTKGGNIDLGGESAMIVQEGRHPTQTLRTQRQMLSSQPPIATPAAKPLPSAEQPVQGPSLMPSLSVGAPAPKPAPAKSKEPTVQMLDAAKVKPVKSFRPVTSRSKIPGLIGSFIRSVRQKTTDLLIFVPLFAMFTAVDTYMFYLLGKICSVHVSAGAGFFQNLAAPFIAEQYAPNQLLFMIICAILLVGIFAFSSLRAFKHTTTILLALTGLSFFAGLFTPQVPFMQLSHVSSHLLSPQYYLCYLVLAVAWGSSLCLTVNRSGAQGLFGASLVVFSMAMAFASAYLSIAPSKEELFFTVLLYASIFCGLCTIFYLLAKSYRDSVFLPFCLFFVAVIGIWAYTVSGLGVSLYNTLEGLIPKVVVRTSRVITPEDAKDDELQETLKAVARPSQFNDLDRTNELTGKSLDSAAKILRSRIERAAPGVYTENTKDLLAEMLAPYYQGGKDPMKFSVWSFALTYPIQHFNRHAKENDAYFFIIAMLYMLGLLWCAGTIVLGDEL